MKNQIQGDVDIPPESELKGRDYKAFLEEAYSLLKQMPHYLAEGEGMASLELAHLFPPAEETVLAIYTGINDAVCNKGLVTPFLIRHAHNSVFAFDPDLYAGEDDVPSGTIDAQKVLTGFRPPNETWNSEWTYVMIADPERSGESLWEEKGYIDMIPAKFEDFTLCSDPERSRICFFVDPVAFSHPVNEARDYLKAARERGEAMAGEFDIPENLKGETEGLVPVVPEQGEKLYIARPDFKPCAHAWSNLHPDNSEWAVVNENSAVPLDLVLAKPPVEPRYAKNLRAPRGSADMTTDWFFRGGQVHRQPLIQGAIAG